MACTDPDLVAGDGLSVLRVTFTDAESGLPKDLTGYDPFVSFGVIALDSDTVIQALVTVPMMPVGDPANGQADYQFTSAELLGGGAYELIGGRLRWEAFLRSGGDVLTSRVVGVEWIRGRLVAA